SFPAITNGEVAPFGAPFGHDASRGRNLYFPFPFANSIKITTTKGDQYFQVNVTTLPKGTKVESYSPEVLKWSLPFIESQRESLGSGRLRPESLEEKARHATEVRLDAGESRDLVPASWSEGRPGAVTAFECKIAAVELDDALARTLLMISFDGADRPQV